MIWLNNPLVLDSTRVLKQKPFFKELNGKDINLRGLSVLDKYKPERLNSLCINVFRLKNKANRRKSFHQVFLSTKPTKLNKEEGVNDPIDL